MYSPLAFVVVQPRPPPGEAHTEAPEIAFLVEASVTVPVILPPTCSDALMALAVPPALIATNVASEARVLPA